ncbi:MAG TPA: antiterminator Q family protein [Thiohalobacter sp.]|nr:antiterminator Q family protein [Thiohalobacter sp.]
MSSAGIDTARNSHSYVQQRLTEWGEWQRNLKGVGLGYSRQASFMADTGGRTSNMLHDEGDNERAESIEEVVCNLRRQYPDLYPALVQVYFNQSPVTIAAQNLKCSERSFRDRLRHAEMFVAGAIFHEPLYLGKHDR